MQTPFRASRTHGASLFTLAAPKFGARLPARRFLRPETSFRPSGGFRTRFSLADKIKALLPDDAIEVSGMPPNADFEVYEPTLGLDRVSLAPYETEVEKAEKLARKLFINECVGELTTNLPLPGILTALLDRITPIVLDSALGRLGVIELGFQLSQLGNTPLAVQYIQSALDDGDVAIGGVSVGDLYSFVGSIQRLYEQGGRPLTTASLDALVQSSFARTYFPQILDPKLRTTWHPEFRRWLGIRLVSVLPSQEATKWLDRYFSQLDGESTAVMGVILAESEMHNENNNEIDVENHHELDVDSGVDIYTFRHFGQWITKSHFHCLASLTATLRTPPQLHSLLRPLLRPSKAVLVDETLALTLLKAALYLQQSYDIANICHTFQGVLAHTRNNGVLADALLAVSFAQKHLPPVTPVMDSSQTLHTFLVARVLPTQVSTESGTEDTELDTHLDSDLDAELNAADIVGWAAKKLYAHYKGSKVPGRVLWQLLLSLPPMKLNNYAETELGRLVVQRPQIEQLRYMALPCVSRRGVLKILEWHVAKIVDQRRAYNIGWNELQDPADIQLLVAGMILSTEKQRVGEAAEEVTKLFELSHLSERSEGSELREASEASDVSEPSDATGRRVTSLEAISLRDKYVPPSLVVQITAELVAKNNFMVARQMLKTLHPKRLISIEFESMLVDLVAAHPLEGHHLMLFLVGFNRQIVPPPAINEILLRLISDPRLSENQIVRSFQKTRGLVLAKLGHDLEPEAATKLVDTLIAGAEERNSGSHNRLKWALGIASEVGVGENVFDGWALRLAQMKERGEGFWQARR